MIPREHIAVVAAAVALERLGRHARPVLVVDGAWIVGLMTPAEVTRAVRARRKPIQRPHR